MRMLRVTRPIPHKICNIMNLAMVKWRTGDIILYHANPFITSVANGSWSHVGIVCISVSGVPLVFDLTGTKHVCNIRPLLPDITRELWHGDHVVAFRRVTPAPNRDSICRYIYHLLKTRVSYDHLYWKITFNRLFGWVFPIDVEDFDAEINNRSICSSMIVKILQQNGIVSESINAYNILPHDFGEHRPSHIRLTNKYKWGPVMFLRMRV